MVFFVVMSSKYLPPYWYNVVLAALAQSAMSLIVGTTELGIFDIL